MANNIIGVQRIAFSCNSCGEPAHFQITRRVESPYRMDSVEHYCRVHMPEDAMRFWNFSMPSFPDTQDD